MAVVSDLSFAEISAKITDPDLKAWWDAIPAAPVGVDTAEMFAKLLQASYAAQVTKNSSMTPAPAPGEALNAYPAPTTGTVQTEPTSGLQFYNATYGVNIVAAVNLDVTTPARV
jgi:hypothetical protein